jgi:hypothetical protein
MWNHTHFSFDVKELCVFKLKLQFFFVISNGASCHGASCPWGELSVGRVVRGASCPWGELSVGRVVHGASCPWGELSPGKIVHWANCLWGELSMGRVVLGRVLMGRVVRGASCPWGELSWGEWSGNPTDYFKVTLIVSGQQMTFSIYFDPLKGSNQWTLHFPVKFLVSGSWIIMFKVQV